MLILISLGAFLMVTLFAVALAQALSARRTQLNERLEMISYDGFTPNRRGDRFLRMQNYSSLPLLQRLLQASPRAEHIADDLDRAGIPLRVGEYLAISVAIGLVFALVAQLWLPQGVVSLSVAAAGFLVGAWVLPRWYVKRRILRRRVQVEAALPDALDIISRSLRTGSGLLASIDAVVEQMGGPIGAELGRMRQEIATGLGVEEAFQELDRRVASGDLHIVVTAILIQREVGGNLAEILDNVATTMRERVRLRQEMRAITSQQRYSTWVVAAVPPGIFLALNLMAHDMMAPMLAEPAGWMALGVAGLLELSGLLILRWITSSFEV